MSVTVMMPQLGETVTEGTILRWAKQPGDAVAEDEILLEISTDKVDTEVPSPAAGVLAEILVPEGETVEVGTPLAVIAAAGEVTVAAPVAEPAAAPTPAAPAAPVPSPAAASPPVPAPVAPPVPAPSPEPPVAPAGAVEIVAAIPEPTPVPATPAGDDLGLLSPVVRKLASEHGIDLSLVTGTGRDARITRKDVQAFIDAGAVAVVVAPMAAPAPGPAAAPAPAAAVEPATAPVPVSTSESMPADETGPRGIPLRPGDRVESITRLRKRIGDNMIEARRTAAHVWTLVEVDYERVEQFRQRNKAAYKEAEGFSLTYLPFIARATIDALRAFPVVNSAFFQEEEQRVLHERVDLGIAVDLDQEGLIVMTVRGAEQMRMRGLARDIRAVAAKARSGEYTLDDVTGSTFTITNPGPYGSLMSAPVINVPNVAILSTDAVQKRPVAVTDVDGGDAIAIHHVGTLGLTWDHRAFDGSTAALFLRHIKQALETWDWEHELS
jgi:2-oxoglutarate dehydrogenase E2 component (dihydrolipoamide succinyltransferase)